MTDRLAKVLPVRCGACGRRGWRGFSVVLGYVVCEVGRRDRCSQRQRQRIARAMEGSLMASRTPAPFSTGGNNMRQARYVVQKAEGVGGDPIPPDEPCLVIRAQDTLAVRMMRTYIDLYSELPGADSAVLEELDEHMTDLIRWQATHKTKVADR